MSKPWEETWIVRGRQVDAEVGSPVFTLLRLRAQPIGGDPAVLHMAAAAPDMYRALESVRVDALATLRATTPAGRLEGLTNIIDRINVALRKARGET